MNDNIKNEELDILERVDELMYRCKVCYDSTIARDIFVNLDKIIDKYELNTNQHNFVDLDKWKDK